MADEIKDNIKTFYAKTRETWRNWLFENHNKEKSVWLIIYKKESETPSVYYPEAVDEALCFGWIDSKPNKRDEESIYQFFSKRKPKSNWSKVNKDKVERLIAEKLMTEAGYEMIKIAKETGTWDALNEVDQLIVPDDMKLFFDKNKVAFEFWEKFPKSAKRGILEWILNAKQAETRQKRIEETVKLAEQNIRAIQYTGNKKAN
jgi:uncharacterized protein YdeI (YjbR/CyaY-like superfamily)